MSGSSKIIVNNLGTMGVILTDVAILSGIVLVCVALFEFKRHGEQSSSQMSQQGSMFGPLATLLAGVIFLVLPLFIHSLLHAFWGSYSPFCWDDAVEPAGAMQGPYDIVVAFVRLVGVISLMRGVYILSKLGKQGGQPGNVSKAVTHMIAGILCVNIVGTYHLFSTILDFST